MKVIVVGINPSNKPTLYGKPNASIKRLECWMNSLSVKYFSFVNTFDYSGIPNQRKVDTLLLKDVCTGYTNVIALGGFVSVSLNRLNIKHFQLPHPSPLNRLLNDKNYETLVLNKCRKYLQ